MQLKVWERVRIEWTGQEQSEWECTYLSVVRDQLKNIRYFGSMSKLVGNRTVELAFRCSHNEEPEQLDSRSEALEMAGLGIHTVG